MQKLAGKGRETGSQTEASKQAGRGKWATEAGKQKHAGRQAGKDRRSRGKVDRHSEAGRLRQAGRIASTWADAGMKKEAGMQAIIDADMHTGMKQEAGKGR
jgi:hypothetical protein